MTAPVAASTKAERSKGLDCSPTAGEIGPALRKQQEDQEENARVQCNEDVRSLESSRYGFDQRSKRSSTEHASSRLQITRHKQNFHNAEGIERGSVQWIPV